MPDASAADFFGEGTYGSQTQAPSTRDWNTNPPRSYAELDQMYRELGYGSYAEAAQKGADAQTAATLARGGTTNTWDQLSPASKAAYGAAHRNNQGGVNWGKVANAAGTALRWTVDPLGSAVGAYTGVDAAQALTSPIGAITAVGTGQVPTNLNAVTGGPQGASPAAPAATDAPVPGATGGVPDPNLPTAPPAVPPTGATGAAPPATTPGQAGTSEGVSDLLKGLNTYQSDIYNLSQDNTGLSVAEAQLQKATALANAQSRQATEQSQRSALGMARGVRNRGDRALAERQAIGEASYIGQEQARTDALRRATAEGDLSILRATEADSDRRFKLEALQAAGALGLNTAALELDIDKVNMQDATERMKIALGYAELDANKARDIMNFTRDMASIQFEYDKLSVEDQNEADRLLMQKYGIDQQTFVALKQIKEQGRFRWDQVLAGFATGASGALGAKVMAGSDERIKTNIEPIEATAKEFDEFMNAITANAYEYKEPEKFGDGVRFGLMAQDLEKTKLGRHMVSPVGGVKMVEIAPLALATASGLALVYERLKDLESAVRS